MKSILFSSLLLLLFACSQANSNQSNANDNEVEQVELTEAPTQTEAQRSMSLSEDFTVEYLMGKFDPAEHPDFTKIAPEHRDDRIRYLRKDAYNAFKTMYEAALTDDVKLRIISATRNFDAQKGIWEAKWTGQRRTTGVDGNITRVLPDAKDRALKILEYSSMPGSSRHHWGTDIDLNNLNNDYFESGEGKKIYDWLRAHAHEYGFCQPYSPKGSKRPYGYNEERWHWSYMPVARQLTELAREKMRDKMITGFQGSEAAERIGIVEKYVLGINPECLN